MKYDYNESRPDGTRKDTEMALLDHSVIGYGLYQFKNEYQPRGVSTILARGPRLWLK